MSVHRIWCEYSRHANVKPTEHSNTLFLVKDLNQNGLIVFLFLTFIYTMTQKVNINCSD